MQKKELTKTVQFDDGTQVVLRYPSYTLADAELSARIPQTVYGLGLLEAMHNDAILARASCDPEAAGVSGRASFALNPETGKNELARFGWKASKVSLRHQVAEALLLDIGVTSPVFPTESCEKEGRCDQGTPELPEEDLVRLTRYMQNIAVPVQRNTDDAVFKRGQAVFQKLGCPSCHIPEQITGDTHPIESLRNQRFFPYTDLLLHDMGPGLAEARSEGAAKGSEWRTPPLWGLGLMQQVNGQTKLLHDGRAQSFEEAILWHDGEAAAMQRAYLKLPKADRDDLTFFLQSL